MYYCNLSQVFHIGESVCLNKFLLASIFKVMDEVVEIMDASGKMKHIVDPLWNVQLWLNEILAIHITREKAIPKDIKLKIEGARRPF